VIVSQTCDLVRSCAERPFAEVCPLVKLLDEEIDFVVRGRRIQFATLPGLNDQSLAADLDRIMTVEKALLVHHDDRRRSGISTDFDARSFADALSRKRSRAALPTAFVHAAGQMRDRVVRNHKKNTAEGRFLRSVLEIRVCPRPNWSASEIEVEFYFIFRNQTGIPDGADHLVDALLSRITTSSDWFVAASGRAVGLDALSAATYLDSYHLDLDHLSYSGSA
jgi:hypothetical protein